MRREGSQYSHLIGLAGEIVVSDVAHELGAEVVRRLKVPRGDHVPLEILPPKLSTAAIYEGRSPVKGQGRLGRGKGYGDRPGTTQMRWLKSESSIRAGAHGVIWARRLNQNCGRQREAMTASECTSTEELSG